MAYEFFVGHDPGEKGGVAVLNAAGELLTSFPMPMRDDKHVDTRRMRFHLPFWDLPSLGGVLIIVEQVWAMPGQGVCSMFSFGRTTGYAIGVLEGHYDEVAHQVSPQCWQKALFGPVPDTKVAAVHYVHEHFPGANFLATARSRVPHSGMVDATCIADYGRRNVQLLTGN